MMYYALYMYVVLGIHIFLHILKSDKHIRSYIMTRVVGCDDNATSKNLMTLFVVFVPPSLSLSRLETVLEGYYSWYDLLL